MPTSKMPLFLTYGSEATIPAKFAIPTHKAAKKVEANNNVLLEIQLDILEEK